MKRKKSSNRRRELVLDVTLAVRGVPVIHSLLLDRTDESFVRYVNLNGFELRSSFSKGQASGVRRSQSWIRGLESMKNRR